MDFAADKLGRTLFFNPELNMEDKTERAICYCNLMINAFEKTEEGFFLMLAESFIGRMANDLFYRGGTDKQVVKVTDKSLYVAKLLEEQRGKNESLNRAFDRYGEEMRKNLFAWRIRHLSNGTEGRRAELMKNTEYVAMLEKYR